jgi:integrase/recombinase XerD
MTDEAMSPLRPRMIEDMTIRKLGRKTQQDYIQIIKKLAAFLGRSPDTATFEDLRRFQLHVVASGVGTAAINRHVSALRFFFRVTLKRYATGALTRGADSRDPAWIPNTGKSESTEALG